ncbi:UPF0147 family protein [Candidatus Woesearchaeota archaeon]|nr:UPF0147 family protein [Candidatus Woesearchaeota archaeon]
MKAEFIENVVSQLSQLELDDTIPRNIRKRINIESVALKEEGIEVDVKFNRLLSVLDDLSTDPNVSSDVRAQIWHLVSILESM